MKSKKANKQIRPFVFWKKLADHKMLLRLIDLYQKYPKTPQKLFEIHEKSSHWVSVIRGLIPWLQRSFEEKTSGQTRKMKKRILGSIH